VYIYIYRYFLEGEKIMNVRGKFLGKKETERRRSAINSLFSDRYGEIISHLS